MNTNTDNWNFEMADAPKDGQLLLLLVEPENHPTEDATLCRTVGSNNLDDDFVDEWRFAGWCWSHDHYTQGTGRVVAWQLLPAMPRVYIDEDGEARPA